MGVRERNVIGGLKENGPHRSLRRCGLVRVGVVLLEEVVIGGGFENSDAQGTLVSHSLPAAFVSGYRILSYLPSTPCMPVFYHAFHYDGNGPTSEL